MARVAILGGMVVDPRNKIQGHRSLICENGKIVALGHPRNPDLQLRRGDRVLDASGYLVLPGLIDMHVHLRQPGMTKAETIRSGTRAAAAGGFTTVVCMPNTKPVLDTTRTLMRLNTIIQRDAFVRVLPAAAFTVGLSGKRLSPMERLAQCGIAAFSDDGVGTTSEKLLGEALQRAMNLGLTVLTHCEDHALSRGGVVHQGTIARRLQLPGIPAAAERSAVVRHLDTLRRSGGRLHIQHVSTASSLAAIQRAKAKGWPVSCEVAPHHLFLTVEHLERSTSAGGPNPNLKMNPPLRSENDRQALLAGLSDGTVDAIASDHAPHTVTAKRRGFLDAPFGVTGLETTLSLVLELVERRIIGLERAVSLLSSGPADILGLDSGSLTIGRAADIVVVDPKEDWIVDPGRMNSRSRNTAFEGRRMKGRVRWTLLGGRLVYGLG